MANVGLVIKELDLLDSDSESLGWPCSYHNTWGIDPCEAGEYRPAQHLKMLTISLNKAGGIITFDDTGDRMFICLILGWKPMKFYRIELHFAVSIWIFHMLQNIN